MALSEAQLTALYTTGHKYRKELLAMPLAQLAPIIAHMSLRLNVRGKESVGEIDTDAELRPYRTAKDATDSTTIVLRELETFLGDVVKEFDPHLLSSTIYGDAIGMAPTDTNIVKMIALLMAKKASNNLAKNLFTAVRKADGNSTADLFNGFCTIISRDITDGKIASGKGNFADLGQITDANVVDKLMEAYQDAMCEEMQGEKIKLFLPRSLYNSYNRGYLTDFGNVAYNKEFKKTFLEGTDDNCELVPMNGMASTNQILFTTKENMLIGCDQSSDQETVRIRECDNPKTAQFFMKLFFGVEFESVSKQRLLVGKYTTTTQE